METENTLQENRSAKWGFIGTLLWGILIACFYVLIQSVVTLLYVHVAHGEMSLNLLGSITDDGTALSFAAFGTMIICSLVVIGIIKLKKHSDIKEYLAIKKISPFEVKLWIGIAVALIIVIDSVTYLFGKPIVVEFMTSIYNSTNHRWFLFLALVVAAPVFEEIFFRGFLLSGFSATFIGPIGAVIITSLTWAAIHLQYDLYGILTIFVIGIVLGVARLKTESIITVIMMHSLMNAIAFFETVIYVSL